jgi:hypothetical protein
MNHHYQAGNIPCLISLISSSAYLITISFLVKRVLGDLILQK